MALDNPPQPSTTLHNSAQPARTLHCPLIPSNILQPSTMFLSLMQCCAGARTMRMQSAGFPDLWTKAPNKGLQMSVNVSN